MRRLVILLVLLALSYAQYEPDCFCLDILEGATNLVSPTAMASPPDGTRRIMISEQTGAIHIIHGDGTRHPTPFLDLSNVTVALIEDGFLAFTFHPNYTTNRKLYVRYTYLDRKVSRLSEFTADAADPNFVDRSTERPLGLDTYEEFINHNGGGLMFGADGYLYIVTGDGGESFDPSNHAQNKSGILGKVLRIDVNTRTGNLEYGIPPDNPFLSDPDATPELYALGLRNPWKASVDPGDRNTGAGRGRIFIGDVGHSTFEEVDILQAGGNYAWAAREGPMCVKPELCGQTEPEVFPVFYYNRTAIGGAAVIGGHVYRGCMNPNFDSWYIFSDFSTWHIFRMVEESPDVWNTKEIFTCSTCPGNMTNVYQQFIQFWGVDYDGELYMGTNGHYDSVAPEGIVYKIVDPSNTQAPCPPAA